MRLRNLEDSIEYILIMSNNNDENKSKKSLFLKKIKKSIFLNDYPIDQDSAILEDYKIIKLEAPDKWPDPPEENSPEENK